MRSDSKLKPAVTGARNEASATALVERVRDCYRRELRIRRVTEATKDATDVALLEAVRADVEYERLVRAVVPPATDGDEIPRVRKLRRQIAARFRKRVQRVTRRHASRFAAADNSLLDRAPEPKDVVMQDRKPIFVRERDLYYDETILPPDVARPVHPEADDDDDEPVLQGPDPGDFDEDEDDED